MANFTNSLCSSFCCATSEIRAEGAVDVEVCAFRGAKKTIKLLAGMDQRIETVI
jgi:hypothetical protein